MVQSVKPKQASIWPVTFPDEKLIVKRPSLRHICQGSADLGELLSYFLYEAGREAEKQGANPLTVDAVTIYHILGEILYTIDYSVSKKVLIRNISELQKLGFIKAFPHEHEYIILLENVRQALALYAKNHRANPPSPKVNLPKSIIYYRQAGEETILCDGVDVHSSSVDAHPDGVDVHSSSVDIHSDGVDVHLNGVDAHPQGYYTTPFDIDPAVSPQADSSGAKDDPRSYRYNKDIKRDNKRVSGDADAIATVSTSLFLSSITLQETPLPQPQSEHTTIQSGDGQKGNSLNMQNKHDTIEKAPHQNSVLEKPDCRAAPTIEAFLALADHYRGYRLTHSPKLNSLYRMALEAATTFMNQKKTMAEVDAVFAYMKGIDEHFCDDWWPQQTVDLWHVMRHFDGMRRKMTHQQAYSSVTQAIARASQGFETHTSDEILQMPLEERKLYLSRLREYMRQRNSH